MKGIIVRDIVIHTISGLYYKCENNKQERWMNDPLSFYEKYNYLNIPTEYFNKKTNK